MLDALLDAPRRGAANALCVTRGGYGRLFGRRQHGNFQKIRYNYGCHRGSFDVHAGELKPEKKVISKT